MNTRPTPRHCILSAILGVYSADRRSFPCEHIPAHPEEAVSVTLHNEGVLTLASHGEPEAHNVTLRSKIGPQVRPFRAGLYHAEFRSVNAAHVPFVFEFDLFGAWDKAEDECR